MIQQGGCWEFERGGAGIQQGQILQNWRHYLESRVGGGGMRGGHENILSRKGVGWDEHCFLSIFLIEV